MMWVPHLCTISGVLYIIYPHTLAKYLHDEVVIVLIHLCMGDLLSSRVWSSFLQRGRKRGGKGQGAAAPLFEEGAQFLPVMPIF